MFMKICDILTELEITIDLALVLNKFGKMLITQKDQIDKNVV